MAAGAIYGFISPASRNMPSSPKLPPVNTGFSSTELPDLSTSPAATQPESHAQGASTFVSPSSEKGKSKVLRGLLTSPHSDEDVQTAITSIYKEMEKQHWTHPRTKEQGGSPAGQIFENGEPRKSEHFRELENALAYVPVPVKNLKTVAAVRSAKRDIAKKTLELEKVGAALRKRIADFLRLRSAYVKKRASVEEKYKAVAKAIEDIENYGNQLIALSQELPKFIAVDERKNYLRGVVIGLANVIEYKAYFNSLKHSLPGHHIITSTLRNLEDKVDGTRIRYKTAKINCDENTNKEAGKELEARADDARRELVQAITNYKLTAKKSLGKELPVAWRHYEAVYEAVQLHKKLRESGFSIFEAKDLENCGLKEGEYDELLNELVREGLSIYSSASSTSMSTNLENFGRPSLLEHFSAEARSQNISLADSAVIPADEYTNLPFSERFHREYTRVCEFQEKIDGAVAAIWQYVFGMLPKENKLPESERIPEKERSREKMLSFVDKLNDAGQRFYELRLQLQQLKKEDLPEEVLLKFHASEEELERRQMLAEAMAFSNAMLAESKLPSLPAPQSVGAADAATALQGEKAAVEDEQAPPVETVAAFTDTAMLDEVLSDTKPQEEQSKKQSREQGKAKELRDKLAPSAPDPAESKTLKLINEVRDYRKAAADAIRHARDALKAYHAAPTMGLKNEWVEQAVARLKTGEQEISSAMQAISRGGFKHLDVSRELDWQQLSRHRTQITREYRRYQAYLASPKSRPLTTTTASRIAQEQDGGFVFRLPMDRPHKRHVRGNKNDPFWELVTTMTPVDAGDAGKLDLPEPYYLHVHASGRAHFKSSLERTDSVSNRVYAPPELVLQAVKQVRNVDPELVRIAEAAAERQGLGLLAVLPDRTQVQRTG